ncbi:molybdopterin dinucleotide-binding region protein [Thermovibrio ammonificans HB-1]|uniref:Molybdopterin dinucleotide-binding region protein n=1 Tax=Thermovibrio ammonificans (strain DSM 15698 / JCM 12110 / HB-1) TaxID=648996 RepID=E8T2Y1_THEA1|nr:4Fe-4S dicluster domain-containing protein [Thermovibrio ammonificans]ADU97190.1 molybdopterin dinucleotide-binding region protein [Thermovibrio ammonificans HB-1]
MERREFLKVAGLTVLVGLGVEVKGAEGKELFKPVLIFDQGKCMSCKACMAACQLEHGLNETPEINLFWIEEKELGEYPKAKLIFSQEKICKQCFEHPCVSACPFNAISVGRGGVVVIDDSKCTGCEKCVPACPFNAIVMDKGNKARKCDICFERTVKGGDVPRCVAVCPSGALVFGNLYKPSGPLAQLLKDRPEVAKALLKSHHAELVPAVERGNPYLYPETKKPKGDRIVNTVCLACNARCGLRVAVKDGKLVQVDGNPYHPYNRSGREIPYTTSLKESFKAVATTCAKPQMDNDYLYNPYRITRPLKRIGKRGEGKFKPISWEQLIREVSEGGYLFKEIGDNRYYPGIKDVLSDEPVDPADPYLGTKRNQLVWFTGRSQAGRSHFIKRWVFGAIGSKNYIAHTDICGIGFRMGNYALSDGKQVEFKADYWKAKYMLVFGSNVYSAQQPGVNTSGAIIARRIAAGELKLVLVDPRAPKAIAHAHDWLPVKPTKDGPLAMGFIRVMLENGWFDEDFLSIPSMKAAEKAGRNVFTNATHLVIVDENHPEVGRFLRVKDVEGLKGSPNEEVVIDPKSGRPVAASEVDRALLEWEGEVGGIKVKTAFKIMKESVMKHPLSFYARESGIPEEKIKKVAKEFWEHAPYSVAFAYHGGGNYVGGLYASYALAMMNALVGNINREGGYLCRGKGAASWQKGLYNLKSFPGAKKPKGVKISREKAVYEKSREFKEKGYPSKLPWFPFTKGGLSVSAISGIDQKYPYPVKVVITYFSDLIYSMPGGRRFIETLKDPDKVPLYISVDTTINETNIYADYIVPDVTYLEGHYGFLTPHAPGCWFTAVRTPVVEPLVGKTKDGRPFCLETFLIDVARHLKLPGYGERAIPGKNGKLYPLIRAEDYYLRGIANLAENAGLKEASEEEIRFVEENYPVAKFKGILSESEWKKVCTLLVRGGVFRPIEETFDSKGNFKFGIPKVHIWNERLGTSRNSLTGERNWGTLRFYPSTDYFGEPVEELDRDYPFNVITYKSALHTQSRTICYNQALVYEPDFSLKINPADAERLGLKTGDRVRVFSRSNRKGVVTTVKVTNLVRPGTVAYSHHFGHWQHGASPVYIENASSVMLGGTKVCNGNWTKVDPRRGVGVTMNRLTRRDPKMFDLPLVEPISGIPDFSSTRVKIEKV